MKEGNDSGMTGIGEEVSINLSDQVVMKTAKIIISNYINVTPMLYLVPEQSLPI